MTPKDRPAAPIACALGLEDAAERKRRFEELCGRALVAQTLTDTGLRLRFRRCREVEDELRELVRLEADCCAFAAFEVTALADAMDLEVSTRLDAVDTVRRLFSPTRGRLREPSSL